MFFVGGESTLIYANDNALADEEQPESPWALIDNETMGEIQTAPFPCAPVTTVSPRDAWDQVLSGAGATRPTRDAVDTRIVAEVREGKGKIIDRPQQTGGWPTYEAGEPPEDTDADGMADAWEEAHGLSATDPTDHAADADRNGYTNLEEYLQELAGGKI
jgi:hypothetical protein